MTTPMPPDPMGNSVAGSNDLQASIDRLDADMRALTTAINGQNNGNGTTTSPAMAPSFASQGVQFTTGGGGGGGGGILGGIIGGGGSGGFTGTNPYSFSGGSGAQAAVNIAARTINGQFLAGSQQLNDQAQINTYGYTQAAFWNVSSKSAIFTAFGGGNGANLTQNNLATSASDARIGGQLLSQISGQANYTAPARGQYGRGNGAFQLAATSGFANPGLGMTNAASISGAFYNPSTSYNLMMMGVANTPLQLGTGRSQSMTGVEAAIGQRFGFQGFNSKTGTFNSQNLSANLDNPLFQMQIMEATGMSQQQYNVWAQQWAMMNNAALKGGTTMGQMQGEISQYMNGSSSQQKAAQAWLTQHGVSQSLLQSMTQAQAGQTGAEAGGNEAFTKGLQAATGMVEKFTAALAKGLQAMAGTSGFAGAIGSLNSTGVIGAGAGGVTNAVLGSIASGASSLAHDLATFSADLTGYINPGSKGGSGGGVGTPSGNAMKYGGLVKQAMQKLGIPASDYNNIMTQMQFESGGNPTAVNKWDSNWAKGTPSVGLMQVIGPTFDSWAGPYRNVGPFEYGVSTNPMANIYAGLNYAIHEYGLGNLNSVLGHGHGYADGTSSAKPGVALVGERGPEVVALSGGQQIISAAQTAKMMQPKFSMPGESSGSGLTIVFQHGAIQITNSGGGTSGYHTSSDVQSSAGQLVQAVETGLRRSTIIKNIAAGVTG